MKKEVIIAIVFGILLGLGVAFIMIAKIRQVESQKAGNIQTTSKNFREVSTAPAEDHTLDITEPQDNAITSKNSTTIKGSAEKDSLIVVQSGIKDLVYQNKTGNFSISFPLALGENVLSVTVYPQNKQLRSQLKILKVYYFNEQ